MKPISKLLTLLLLIIPIVACNENNNPGNDDNVTVDGSSAKYTQYSIGWSASIDTDYVIEYDAGFTSGASYPRITVSLGNHIYTTYSQADFFNFFTTGNKPFADDSNTPGASITYAANSSTYYSTIYGSQSGNSINFTSFTNQPGSGANPDRVKFNVTFDVTVYNPDNLSDTKEVSGTLEGRFEKY